MCNCGGSSTPAAPGPSMSSFGASGNKWIVYRADGTTAEFDSEPAARMEVTRTGGSMRRK